MRQHSTHRESAGPVKYRSHLQDTRRSLLCCDLVFTVHSRRARVCVCVCVCVFSLSCQDLLTADPLGDAGWLQWSRLQWSRLHADSLVFVALEQVYECQSCVASHCMSRHASKQMRSRVVYMLVPPLSCPMLPLKYSSFSVPTRCPSNVFGLLCAWLL